MLLYLLCQAPRLGVLLCAKLIWLSMRAAPGVAMRRYTCLLALSLFVYKYQIIPGLSCWLLLRVCAH